MADLPGFSGRVCPSTGSQSVKTRPAKAIDWIRPSRMAERCPWFRTRSMSDQERLFWLGSMGISCPTDVLNPGRPRSFPRLFLLALRHQKGCFRQLTILEMSDAWPFPERTSRNKCRRCASRSQNNLTNSFATCSLTKEFAKSITAHHFDLDRKCRGSPSFCATDRRRTTDSSNTLVWRRKHSATDP